MAYRQIDREQFSGADRWIEVTWDATSQRWDFRPVFMAASMTAEELTAVGLDVPLTSPASRPAPQAFSQRDPRWAEIRLGASAYTMGGAGCAVTAAAMVASVVQPAVTPLTLVDWLNVNYGFTGGGLLYWGKVAEAVPGLKFVAYHLWRAVPADMALLTLALQNGPQVIQVDFHPETATLDSHFVTAVRMLDDGADLEIIDPWTGASGPLLALYSAQNWTLARAVYALVEFKL